MGQHFPGDAAFEHEDDARERSSVGDPGVTASVPGRFGRQQRFDFGPEFVRHERLGNGANQSSPPLSLPVLLGALSYKTHLGLAAGISAVAHSG